VKAIRSYGKNLRTSGGESTKNAVILNEAKDLACNVFQKEIGDYNFPEWTREYFLPGEKSVESLALDILMGPAVILGIGESCDLITVEEIKNAGYVPGTLRVLFKTRNSHFWNRQLSDFQTGFVGLDAGGAKYLVENGVRLVGIDYLSIAPYKNSKPTHETLLKAGVIILEGIDLSHVEPGPCELICLPLKLGGADGSPARAVIIKEQLIPGSGSF
jgi:arylformamidase